jgi:hypothetical protein
MPKVALGTAWSLTPKRLASVVPMAGLCALQLFEPD